MELIEVTARFDRRGDVTPLNFEWRDREYKVISVGRDWQDETGCHILVMVPGDRVYELVFSVSEMCWRLERVGLDQKVV